MMTTRDEFAARVPDAAQRREALALFQAMVAAELARDESGEFKAVEAKYQPILDAARNDYHKRIKEITDQREVELAAQPLHVACEAAEKAWQDLPTSEYECGHDDEPILCALSGLPIFEDDAVVKDPETGERVLKVCLGVPLDEDDGMAFVFDDEVKPAEAA
jgi:hypothetical protein